jgi:hypothetical protein
MHIAHTTAELSHLYTQAAARQQASRSRSSCSAACILVVLQLCLCAAAGVISVCERDPERAVQLPQGESHIEGLPWKPRKSILHSLQVLL